MTCKISRKSFISWNKLIFLGLENIIRITSPNLPTHVFNNCFDLSFYFWFVIVDYCWIRSVFQMCKMPLSVPSAFHYLFCVDFFFSYYVHAFSVFVSLSSGLSRSLHLITIFIIDHYEPSICRINSLEWVSMVYNAIFKWLYVLQCLLILDDLSLELDELEALLTDMFHIICR